MAIGSGPIFTIFGKISLDKKEASQGLADYQAQIEALGQTWAKVTAAMGKLQNLAGTIGPAAAAAAGGAVGGAAGAAAGPRIQAASTLTKVEQDRLNVIKEENKLLLDQLQISREMVKQRKLLDEALGVSKGPGGPSPAAQIAQQRAELNRLQQESNNRWRVSMAQERGDYVPGKDASAARWQTSLDNERRATQESTRMQRNWAANQRELIKKDTEQQAIAGGTALTPEERLVEARNRITARRARLNAVPLTPDEVQAAEVKKAAEAQALKDQRAANRLAAAQTPEAQAAALDRARQTQANMQAKRDAASQAKKEAQAAADHFTPEERAAFDAKQAKVKADRERAILEGRGTVSGARSGQSSLGIPPVLQSAVNTLGSIGFLAQYLGIWQSLMTAFKYSASSSQELETLRIRLNGVASSAGDAAKTYKYFLDYARTSPFDFEDIAKAGTKFKALGLDTERLLDVTSKLAATFEPTREGFQEMAQGVAKASSGSAEGIEILRNRAGLSTDKLKELGVQMDSTGGIILRSRAEVDKFSEAIGRYADQVSKNGQTLKDLQDSLQTKFSNVHAAVFQTAAAFGDVFAPALKGVLDVALGILDVLRDMPVTLKQVTLGVLSLGTAFIGITKFMALIKFAQGLSGAITAFSGTAGGSLPLTGAAASLTESAGALTAAAGALTGAAEKQAVVGGVGGATAGAAGAATDAEGAAEGAAAPGLLARAGAVIAAPVGVALTIAGGLLAITTALVGVQAMWTSVEKGEAERKKAEADSASVGAKANADMNKSIYEMNVSKEQYAASDQNFAALILDTDQRLATHTSKIYGTRPDAVTDAANKARTAELQDERKALDILRDERKKKYLEYMDFRKVIFEQNAQIEKRAELANFAEKMGTGGALGQDSGEMRERNTQSALQNLISGKGGLGLNFSKFVQTPENIVNAVAEAQRRGLDPSLIGPVMKHMEEMTAATDKNAAAGHAAAAAEREWAEAIRDQQLAMKESLQTATVADKLANLEERRAELNKRTDLDKAARQKEENALNREEAGLRTAAAQKERDLEIENIRRRQGDRAANTAQAVRDAKELRRQLPDRKAEFDKARADLEAEHSTAVGRLEKLGAGRPGETIHMPGAYGRAGSKALMPAVKYAETQKELARLREEERNSLAIGQEHSAKIKQLRSEAAKLEGVGATLHSVPVVGGAIGYIVDNASTLAERKKINAERIAAASGEFRKFSDRATERRMRIATLESQTKGMGLIPGATINVPGTPGSYEAMSKEDARYRGKKAELDKQAAAALAQAGSEFMKHQYDDAIEKIVKPYYRKLIDQDREYQKEKLQVAMAGQDNVISMIEYRRAQGGETRGLREEYKKGIKQQTEFELQQIALVTAGRRDAILRRMEDDPEYRKQGRKDLANLSQDERAQRNKSGIEYTKKLRDEQKKTYNEETDNTIKNIQLQKEQGDLRDKALQDQVALGHTFYRQEVLENLKTQQTRERDILKLQSDQAIVNAQDLDKDRLRNQYRVDLIKLLQTQQGEMAKVTAEMDKQKPKPLGSLVSREGVMAGSGYGQTSYATLEEAMKGGAGGGARDVHGKLTGASGTYADWQAKQVARDNARMAKAEHFRALAQFQTPEVMQTLREYNSSLQPGERRLTLDAVFNNPDLLKQTRMKQAWGQGFGLTAKDNVWIAPPTPETGIIKPPRGLKTPPLTDMKTDTVTEGLKVSGEANITVEIVTPWGNKSQRTVMPLLNDATGKNPYPAAYPPGGKPGGSGR